MNGTRVLAMRNWVNYIVDKNDTDRSSTADLAKKLETQGKFPVPVGNDVRSGFENWNREDDVLFLPFLTSLFKSKVIRTKKNGRASG